MQYTLVINDLYNIKALQLVGIKYIICNITNGDKDRKFCKNLLNDINRSFDMQYITFAPISSSTSSFVRQAKWPCNIIIIGFFLCGISRF